MVTQAPSDGSLALPEPLRRALVYNAHWRADLTASALAASGLFETEPPQLPGAFLLELSAVLEIGYLERQGLLEHLSGDVPTFSKAVSTLANRCLRGPSEFERPDATPLSEQLLRVRVEQLAWEGPELLHADFVVTKADEDAFDDALAEFIWAHRRELAHLFGLEGGSVQ
jgi:hypothetical protein